jgi:succinate dehydrogenase/fumarate reductase cytochrome b subunit
MEENKSLYWKHFKIWISGIMISFPIAGIFGYLFRAKDPNFVIPISIAILSFPLVFHGIYGLTRGFCMSWRYGYVHRGKMAKIWNTIDLVLYVGVVLLVILIGGKEFP